MIPLNRPYNIPATRDSNPNLFLEENFQGYQHQLLFASRDGLNIIYQQLHEKYGSLRVLVSPLSCFIALYPIVQNGHIPVFVDVNQYTLNMDEDEVIKRNDVQAIQLIYLGGNPFNMDKIIPWAKSNGIIIIEDCAQALGSSYKNQMLGSFGDYSVFSMVKNLHAVAGGMLLYKNELDTQCINVISKNVMAYKHVKRYLECRANANQNNIFNYLYEHLLLLKESKLDETKHQLSVPQSRKLGLNDISSIMELLSCHQAVFFKRLENTKIMIDGINKEKYFIQQEMPYGKSNRNRLILSANNRNAKELIIELRNKGIAANNLTQSYINGYQEHIEEDKMLSPFYNKRLEVYETVFPTILAIPNSPSLSKQEIDYITSTINELS